MRERTLRTVASWSFWLMVLGMVLAIVTGSGILSSAVEAQIPDLDEGDFEKMRGSINTYRASVDSYGIGTMTISVARDDDGEGNIGITIKEGGSRIYNREEASLPLTEFLQISGGGEIEITLTLLDDSFSFSDLDIQVSVPSAFPFAATVCGIFAAPVCCSVWIGSLAMGIIGLAGIVQDKRHRGGLR